MATITSSYQDLGLHVMSKVKSASLRNDARIASIISIIVLSEAEAIVGRSLPLPVKTIASIASIASASAYRFHTPDYNLPTPEWLPKNPTFD